MTCGSSPRHGQHPDPDEDPDKDFGERYRQPGTATDNAGRLRGDLTPECSAAVQAVLESLGRKRGPEDDRTTAQRRHDALQEACDLRMAACLMPNQAGSVSLAGGGGIRSR
jgi:hypothetical protein